jgi:hypothetical protein
MLDLPRYLLGVAELLWLAGFAWLGGTALRSRLLSGFTGAPAYLATAVLSLALLIWVGELLGSFGLFEPVSYLLATTLLGVTTWALLRRVAWWRGSPIAKGSRSESEHMGDAAATGPAGRGDGVVTWTALAIAAVALVKFGIDVKSKLSTGMTGFDSTWYHGPFAAGFFQSGNTWALHFIAPQFLAWFYPANAEIFHALGMSAFDRDILSPLLNLGWFAGCLVASWCVGRPYRVAPWSLALGAIALSLPVLSDQAGEARNDVVGIFFLLAAVAVALNAFGRAGAARGTERTVGAAIVVGLAAGLAAGTKLNFLLPAAILVLGTTFVAPAGRRGRALTASFVAALAGGGYWYLRNLAHTGNPLPWFDSLGPISLPAPAQALGGREGHSVLAYLTDGSVWSDWFLPGLHGGLTILWPLIAALALAGLLLCLVQPGADRAADRALLLAGLTGLAVLVAWLIAPTSASGPDGMPRGFESGLRYLAPALVLGLTILPASLLRRVAWRRGSPIAEGSQSESEHMGDAAATGPAGREHGSGGIRRLGLAGGALAALIAIAIGYPVQRHYLENRYANPTFAAPGLNEAFKRADGISDSRIATTSTRQYPLFGADLSNHVQYIGEERPHGGFTAPATCPQWRRLLDEGHYDYAVTTRDRIEPGKPPYPPTTRWTEGPGARPILKTPPTVVFRLTKPLDPSACPD